MNILHVNSGTGWSGGQHQIMLLTRGLIGRGHHVVLACPPESLLAKKAAAEGIPVEPVEIGSHFSPGAALALRGVIERHRIEIVNPHKPKPHTTSMLAVWMARGLGAATSGGPPRIVTTRRVSFPIRRHPFVRAIWVGGADRIIAVAESVREGLIRSGIPAGHVVTIHGAVDTNRFHPMARDEDLLKELGLDPDSVIIGKVADYRPWKGYSVFLEAAARILADRPGIRFLAIGKKTPYLPELIEQARRLGIERRVIFTGFRDDVERFYTLMRVSVNAATGGEGIPGVLRESMAMEVPVVASEVGGNRELITNEKTGLLVPPGRSGDLAGALLRLLEDAALCRSLAEAGRRAVEEDFSIDAMVRRTEEVYRTVLERE